MHVQCFCAWRMAYCPWQLLNIAERNDIRRDAADEKPMSRMSDWGKFCADFSELSPVFKCHRNVRVIGTTSWSATFKTPVQQVSALRSDEHYRLFMIEGVVGV
ncbi:hypothetical protein BHQ16_22425 [Mycobacterium shimoidei]|nr:hypothetical protein BHQ16_22425 [Mycobacterium shimoidei]